MRTREFPDDILCGLGRVLPFAKFRILHGSLGRPQTPSPPFLASSARFSLRLKKSKKLSMPPRTEKLDGSGTGAGDDETDTFVKVA
jgi:hypothetical protein